MEKFFTTISIVLLVILLVVALWVFTAIFAGVPDQGVISIVQFLC